MLGQIFKAYDVRATYPDKLNEPAAKKVGFAAGTFLLSQAKGQGRDIVVSRDMRPSSPSLCDALIEGLLASGANVIDVGMADTSIQYFAINHVNAVGGIQTTASHNPIHYNGFKISSLQARPVGASTGLKEIQALAEKLGDTLPSAGTPGEYSTRDVWAEYRRHILSFYKPGPRKLSVFIDGSNGMAGKMVPAVFSGLPGLTIHDVNFEILGKFVHEPNPLVAENMKPTREGVVRFKADLGACFDGDADRCILTDEKGDLIGCDHLTALLAEYFLKQSPGAGVVYDLRSSKAVEEAIRKLGGKPVRSRVGHVFLKAALRENNAVFGGELSGHFYFRDNFFADSGAIAMAASLTILSHSDKPLSELIGPHRRFPQSGELNFRVEDKAGVFAYIKSKYASVGSIDELDGVTVDGWDKMGWWFNVRASNTEPLLRLNAEGKNAAKLAELLHEITPKLGVPDHGH